MLRAVASAQIALLFLALALPTNAQTEVWLVEGAGGEVRCAVGDVSAARWAVAGGALSPRWVPGETTTAEGVTAVLRVDRVTADLEGHYRCAPPPAPYVHVRVRPLTATSAAPVLGFAGVSVAEHSLMFDPRAGNLSLACPLESSGGAAVTWSKNGTAVEQIGELTGRYDTAAAEKGRFTITGKPVEADWGNYTCNAGGASHTWEVRGRPTAHIAANTNVVEGQRLRLVCTLKGMPYPAVTWRFTNATFNATEVTATLGDRVRLDVSEQGVEGAALLVESALRSDAGSYECTPQVEGATAATTEVRVKDMYAALWPFLGICAEVFVLCAVILVYERRRTKPEMDDSDTDHDQKKS